MTTIFSEETMERTLVALPPIINVFNTNNQAKHSSYLPRQSARKKNQKEKSVRVEKKLPNGSTATKEYNK